MQCDNIASYITDCTIRMFKVPVKCKDILCTYTYIRTYTHTIHELRGQILHTAGP